MNLFLIFLHPRGNLSCVLLLSYCVCWHLYLQNLWLPSPSSKASDFQALLSLRLIAGESHGRQREPLLVTDVMPLYDCPEPSTHSRYLSAQNYTENPSVKAINSLIIRISSYQLFVKLYLLDIWARNITPRQPECLYRCNTKDCCHCQGSWRGEEGQVQ